MPPAGDSSDYYEDEPEREPRSMRWLVGGLLAVVLIAGLVFALTNLGSLFNGGPQANPSTATTGTSGPGTGTRRRTQVRQRLRRYRRPSKTSPDRAISISQPRTTWILSKAFDGNAASYWSDMEFATEAWGGLAPTACRCSSS